MTGPCDYCLHDVDRTYLTRVGDDEDARLCRACCADVAYCRSGGRIPQNPEDQP